MKGADIAEALGKQASSDGGDEPTKEEGSSDEYGSALDDIVSGLGVEAKDREALRSGLRAFVARCMADDEAPASEKRSVASVLGKK